MQEFSGTWRLDFTRSKLHGPTPAGMLMRIEHRDPAFTQTIRLEYADGRSMQSVFEGTTTGEEFVNSVGGQTVRSRASWKDSELVIESWVDTGKRQLNFRDHWFLRGDTLIMEHRDDDLAGQIAVLERAPETAAKFDGAA